MSLESRTLQEELSGGPTDAEMDPSTCLYSKKSCSVQAMFDAEEQKRYRMRSVILLSPAATARNSLKKFNGGRGRTELSQEMSLRSSLVFSGYLCFRKKVSLVKRDWEIS